MPSRMKQALFNILGDRIREAVVLDLFAGTGSLGLEAASRGARRVTMIEKNRKPYAVMETNTNKTHLREKCSVVLADAYRSCDVLSENADPFNIVFLDPPYAQSEDQSCKRKLAGMLTGLAQTGTVDSTSVIVLHVRAAEAAPDNLLPPLELIDFRRYGTGALIICRLKKTLAVSPDTMIESRNCPKETNR